MTAQDWPARRLLPLAAPAAGLLLLLALPALLGAIDQGFLVGTATRILIYGIAATSLNFLLGYGGMVSLGHAAYLGIGAYVTGILSVNLFEDATLLGLGGSNLALVAWPASMLVAGIFALAIGALSLRTKGIYFIMITLAFAQMVYYLAVSLERYGGDDGFMMIDGRSRLPGLDLAGHVPFYFAVLALFLLAAWGFHRATGSRFGIVLQGCRENEPRMRALGCPTYRYKLAAFVIAGAVTGLAGALLANLAEYVSPDYMHWTQSGDLLVMVILGGVGTALGPLLGVAAFFLIEAFLPGLLHLAGLPDLAEHWRVLFGPFLVLVVLFSRGGILGGLRRLPDLLPSGRRDARG